MNDALQALLARYSPASEISAASTLPAPWYRDPDLAELERERVFSRTWQLFTRLEKLSQPGDFVSGEVAGEPLVAACDMKGELRVLSNVCRHRASLLVSGAGNLKSLQCPYHGWTYGLDGALKSAREFE